jgi:hypothetical protein
MCPACVVTLLMVGTAGGASALLWSTRWRKKAKPSGATLGPPTATFKEWVASVVSLEEALRATGPQVMARGEVQPQPSDQRA